MGQHSQSRQPAISSQTSSQETLPSKNLRKATVSLWELEISVGALPPVSIAVPWSEGEARELSWRAMSSSNQHDPRSYHSMAYHIQHDPTDHIQSFEGTPSQAVSTQTGWRLGATTATVQGSQGREGTTSQRQPRLLVSWPQVALCQLRGLGSMF